MRPSKPSKLVFETSGNTVEIYRPPDASGGMEYLGYFDLFSEALMPEGKPAVRLPAFVKAAGRRAAEEWIEETLDKLLS
jgi:hypothetical protein